MLRRSLDKAQNQTPSATSLHGFSCLCSVTRGFAFRLKSFCSLTSFITSSRTCPSFHLRCGKFSSLSAWLSLYNGRPRQHGKWRSASRVQIETTANNAGCVRVARKALCGVRARPVLRRFTFCAWLICSFSSRRVALTTTITTTPRGLSLHKANVLPVRPMSIGAKSLTQPKNFE